jgi:hypothetical protein
MKSFITLLAFLTIASCLYAQNNNRAPVRHIRLHTVGRDSIDLSLNESFELIEDSCAAITRHAHINLRARKFIGKFKDVSTMDSSIVLAEGNYTEAGLKDGLFISRYPDGKVQSKGVFKNNKPEGRWETFYENDKPAMVYEAHGDTIKILDTWDAAGKKVVENGKGTYQVSLGTISWKGKLENGRPDGTWRAFKTDDATQSEMVSEYFKKGKLQKGSSAGGNYTDTSRIVLLNEEFLPYVHAEKLRTPTVPCDGVKAKHIVRAQYANGGLSTYTELISRAVNPVVRSFDIRAIDYVLILDGEVSQTGSLQHFRVRNEFDNRITRALINALQSLPLLQPATADGKPIIQKFSITFTFNLGTFRYSYKFLPIDRSSL